MRMYDIIRKKRNGEELTDKEIAFFVNGYTHDEIPDAQAAALCMAICLNGMTSKETVTLTNQMACSGDRVDLSKFGQLSVDKHSTGGVGDKTSLIVAPIVASLGGKVAKMSGRGLGYTGGTIDKLESIPGFRTSLSTDAFIAQVEKVGIAIIGQTGNLAPADKKLYALRDVTATADSIPLITSSIMSKKLAAGAHSIVLDVKVGSGAFMKTPEEARILAESMVSIGKSCGRKMAALLTNMDAPLGRTVGNALEIQEAVDLLKNRRKGDLWEVCVALASEMTMLFREITEEQARVLVLDALHSGKAYAKIREWIAAQGGDLSFIDRPALLPQASVIFPVLSPKNGYIFRMDAEQIGSVASVLGAGRVKKEDRIDHAAGIVLSKKTGDFVQQGDVLCHLHTNDSSKLEEAEKRFLDALVFGKAEPPPLPMVYSTVR